MSSYSDRVGVISSWLEQRPTDLEADVKRLFYLDEEIVLLRVPPFVFNAVSSGASTQTAPNCSLLTLPSEILTLIAGSVDPLSRPHFAITCKAILSIYSASTKSMNVRVGDLLQRSQQVWLRKTYPFLNWKLSFKQFSSRDNALSSRCLHVPQCYARTQGFFNLIETFDTASMIIIAHFRNKYGPLALGGHFDESSTNLETGLCTYQVVMDIVFGCDMRDYNTFEDYLSNNRTHFWKKPIWYKLGFTAEEFEKLATIPKQGLQNSVNVDEVRTMESTLMKLIRYLHHLRPQIGLMSRSAGDEIH